MEQLSKGSVCLQGYLKVLDPVMHFLPYTLEIFRTCIFMEGRRKTSEAASIFSLIPDVVLKEIVELQMIYNDDLPWKVMV